MTGATDSSSKRRTVDTKTRYAGIFARHQLRCAKAINKDDQCTCRPSYYGKVWDRSIGRHRPTKRRPAIAEARNLRDDLRAKVRSGAVPTRPTNLRFADAHKEFIEDCRDGIALNKQGAPYTEKSIRNLDSSLKGLPKAIRDKQFASVAGAELQAAIDAFRRSGLSSSRINGRINAVRSLYTWGEHRGKVDASPAKNLRLPVVRYDERRRIARPLEFADMLDCLEPQDALPWALGAYGTARLQEIQILEWTEVDFERDLVLLADDDRARKSEAAWRVVPLVSQLRGRLWAEWIRQGKPEAGRVCPPRVRSKSGLLSLNQLSKRVGKRWRDLGLEPIGLQDSRHTAATWLDHAGVSPKVASVFMGHKAPRRASHPEAAPITLRRYTHVLDGELERARDSLGAFLAEREDEEREAQDADGVGD